MTHLSLSIAAAMVNLGFVSAFNLIANAVSLVRLKEGVSKTFAMSLLHLIRKEISEIGTIESVPCNPVGSCA